MVDSIAQALAPSSSSEIGGISLDTVLKQYGDIVSEEKGHAADLRAKGAEISDTIRETRKIAVETPIPSIPELTPVPKVENRSPMDAFGSAASWLAVFGSMLTRNPLVSSLNASAGVINAWKEQDAAKAKQDFEVWKAETENAQKLHDYQMENYKAAMDKLKEDRQGGLAEMQVLAASYKDNSVALLAQKGMVDSIKDLMVARDSQFRKYSENASKLEALNNYKEWEVSPEGQAATPVEKAAMFMQMTAPSVAAANAKAAAKVEGEKQDYQGAVEMLEGLKGKIETTPGMTGVAGMGNRALETLGTMLPGSAGISTPASDFESALEEARLELPKKLTGSSKSAKDERQRIEKVLKGLKITDTDATTLNAINQLEDMLREKGGMPPREKKASAKSNKYKIGDVVPRPDGKKFKITGFDTDGTPLGVEAP